MDAKEDLFARIKRLLHSQLFGVLSTQGPEYPYGSLVCYATSPDLTGICFATVRDTRKYSNLKASPRVSLLINNQTNKVSDCVEAHALTVLGVAAEVDAESLDAVLNLFLTRHPYLKDFVCAPNCAIINIHVNRYISVTNFQSVMEYTMS
jgi:heme iron utilization protein